MSDDLRGDDTALAIEVHFDPVRVLELSSFAGVSSECSTDGFYDANTGQRPTILFAGDVARERARFTLLHELGHHLLNPTAADLLDDIDALASGQTTPTTVEEAVCHRFAGFVLIDDEELLDVIGTARLRPEHVVTLYDRCAASWEAVAVRAATSCEYKSAVVLIREPGIVAFSAGSSRLDPHGGRVARGSTLAGH